RVHPPRGVRRGRDRSARPNLPKKVTPRTSGTLRTVADDSVGAEPGELVLPEPEHPAQDRAVVLPQSRRRRAQPTLYARIAERKHWDGVRAPHGMGYGLEEAACDHLWVLAHTTRVHHRRRRDPGGQKPRHEWIALMLACPRGERRVDPVVRRASAPPGRELRVLRPRRPSEDTAERRPLCIGGHR